jgi:hypothetical protein
MGRESARPQRVPLRVMTIAIKVFVSHASEGKNASLKRAPG